MSEYTLIKLLMLLFYMHIVNTYQGIFSERRKSRRCAGWMAWGAYVLFQCRIMWSNARYPLLNVVINFMLIVIVYKCSYHIGNRAALFRTAILYTVWRLVEVAANYMLEKTGTVAASSYDFIVGNIISKILMYILVYALKCCRKSGSEMHISIKYRTGLFFIPVVTIYVIYKTFLLTYGSRRNVFFLLITVFMILINYIAFVVYDKLGILMETEKKNLLYEQQIALCNKQATERENAYQETKRVRHDINGYLLDLRASVQSGELEEAVKKIDALLWHNSMYHNEVSRSGNIVIDSLINYKYSVACGEGICMKCVVRVPSRLPFDGADLCIILGNLLDNAIEAAVSLPDGQRHMALTIVWVKESLSIAVQNFYGGKIRRSATGQLLTNKKDGLNHGIGLTSVQRSVDKYGGELLTDYGNGLFKATVLLYASEGLKDDA